MQEQLKRELLMNEIGVRDLRKDTGTKEERMYASHTGYGNWARAHYIEPIALLMTERANEVKAGRVSEGAAAIAPYLDLLPWDKIAHITLSTMLDCAGIPRSYQWTQPKEVKANHKMLLVNVYRTIGKRLEAECRLAKLKKNFRKAYQKLKDECFTQNTGYSQKLYRFKRRTKDREDFWRKVSAGQIVIDNFLGEEGLAKASVIAEVYHWDDWPDSTVLQIGAWLSRCVNDVTQWFAESRAEYEESIRLKGGKKRVVKRRRYQLFVFQKRFDELRAAFCAQEENFAYFELPMLVPPRDWTSEAPGGYWFQAYIISQSLIRGRDKKTVVGQKTLDFINAQQRVPFKINRFVLNVLKHMHEHGMSLDSFRPMPQIDKPNPIPALEGFKRVPPDKMSFMTEKERERTNKLNKLLRKYKDDVTVYHDLIAEREQLVVPIRLFFKAVNYIQDDPCFYFPWSLDWRTRCYPLISAISPQGPEYMKACLSFGEDQPIDEFTSYWLANTIGVAAGLSKAPYSERVAWVEQNTERVIATATDPLGEGLEVWMGMDEPFIFLAACKEYYDIYLAPEGKRKLTTNFFANGHDATCSGLQCLGGMVRDQVTCELVNCTGGYDSPQDAYGAVLAETLRLISAENKRFPCHKLVGKRSIIKPAVMTKPYGAGHETRFDQIKEALQDEKIRLAKNPDRNDELIEYLTLKVEEAMRNVIPGADQILDWFQKASRMAHEEKGAEVLLIETASGNVIVSEYREPLTKIVETETLGATVFMEKRAVSNRGTRDKETSRITAITGLGDPDVAKSVLGIGANLTHGSGDATLLQLAFHDADFDFCTTHDCVYTPANKTANLVHDRIRHAFIAMCEYPTLQRFAELNGIPEMVPPMVNTYDPEQVLESEYFFC